MIGGDEYLKVARSLLKAEDATDEEIASSTGLGINMVRKVLYDLFGKSLITGIRVKDERKGWFVYRWRSRREEVENFIENQKKKISERLQQRLDYENSSEFYHCGNEDCPRITFEGALEAMFKCPSCGQVVNLKKNEKAKKAFAKKIDEIAKDMQQTFQPVQKIGHNPKYRKQLLDVLSIQKSVEYEIFQQKCDQLLRDDEIRFAGLINHMGRLVAGGFKDGISPLEDEAERRKMYMELALRVSMRMEFDYTLGPVKYSASRREKAVMMSLPLNNNVLLVSAEPSIDIEKFAQKVLKIVGKV